MLFNKKYPRLILVISVIILSVFTFIFIYFKNTPINNENLNQLLFKKIKDKSVNSVITNKSIDFSNHGATYVVFGRDSLPTHTGWDEKIEIGDSIIKPKGSLKLVIKNNFKTDTLDYENNQEEILTTNF
ncbi:hypothetical protein SAMN05443633_10198 [Chryseobacterium arachidis]|uniref:Uncharacterized protein n=2 Tax=Chryseobacterium arachidis TaxID=1416778 RepID=A0A1M4SXW4_9FLAO|nr:hypothetical protein SAMN05443633_10198 [Chryseobacterium arachidis]